MGVFHDGMGLSEKVIYDEGHLRSTIRGLKHLLPVLLYQGEYLGWHRLVSDVYLVLSLRISHVAGAFAYTRFSRACQLLPLEQLALILRH